MAEVRILQDGGKDIIPVTHEDAVLDNNGVKISDKYTTKEEHNEDMTNVNTVLDVLANNKQDSEDSNLITENKTIVGAINELFQCGTNVKQSLVDILVASDQNVSTNDSWDTLFTALGEKGKEPEYILQSNQLNSNYSFYTNSGFTHDTTNGLYSSHNSTTYESVSINQLINFDNIISIKIRAHCTSSAQHAEGYCIVLSNNLESGVSNVLGDNYNNSSYKSSFVPSGPDWVTQTFDVSSWKGNGYLALIRNSYGGHTFYVSDITLVYKPGSGLLGSSGGGLDIFSATELPATGKDGQICVIMDNPINDFALIGTKTSISNKVCFYLGNEYNYNANFTNTIGNIEYSYYIGSVSYNNSNLRSYYWKNNIWNELTIDWTNVWANSTFNSALVGSLNTGTYATTSGKDIVLYSMSGYDMCATFSKKINFSNYNTVKVTCKSASGTQRLEVIGSTRTYAGTNYVTSGINTDYTSSKDVTATAYKDYYFDISSWSGEGYLGFLVYTQGYKVYITNVSLN